MEQRILTVLENTPLTKDVYKMVLQGDMSAITASGQFVNLKIDGLYLRRPISVCDYAENTLTLIYKVVGKGTEVMKEFAPGTQIDTLLGLGNGYNTERSGDKPLLLGGGVGVPPMYNLCRVLRAQGKDVTVVLGFNTADEVFYEKEFEALGAKVFVTTVDGTRGTKGFVTDVLSKIDYTYFYTCGPMPMLRALAKATVTEGEFSFEERMGCGFGACMGCSCETMFGSKRVCKDGPVFEKKEIKW